MSEYFNFLTTFPLFLFSVILLNNSSHVIGTIPLEKTIVCSKWLHFVYEDQNNDENWKENHTNKQTDKETDKQTHRILIG